MVQTPIAVLICLLLLAGCKETSPAPGGIQVTRTYRMGFSGIPPRADINLAIASIDLWSLRADAAIMSFEPPWDSLLAGTSPESLIARDQVGLANYFRFKGHELWIYLDPANGLNRAGESDALVRNGRSITEPAIRQMFRRYAVVIDSMVRPEHLGLALETNLIRGLSPPLLYNAIKTVANDAAADVRARNTTAKLSVSVQVDYAWGRYGGPYQGIDQDFADFPFMEEIGLSSYPYLAQFQNPEEMPLDYYSRLLGVRPLRAMVTEGGWTSDSLNMAVVSSQEKQRRYINRHAALLDAVGAIAVFQLTFTDLDLVAHPPDPGSILPLFARLGLVDTSLHPKPALAAWDSIFARPRQ